MSRFGIWTLAGVCLLCLGTTQQHLNAAITVARIGGGGYLAANTVFSSGDLSGSITDLTTATFNAMSVSDLLSNYDALLFGWPGDSLANLDWTTRLLPYLEGGGGVIFEQPANVGDLLPGVTAQEYNTSGAVAVTPVAGLTDGITGQFANSHIRFTAWDSNLSPFLTLGADIVGLYGEFGTQGGRIVLTGPDQDYHAVRGGSGAGGNQYNLLVNELSWVTSGTASEVVPEPATLGLWSIGGACLAWGARRRRMKAS
jgi:hypothetical protein